MSVGSTPLWREYTLGDSGLCETFPHQHQEQGGHLIQAKTDRKKARHLISGRKPESEQHPIETPSPARITPSRAFLGAIGLNFGLNQDFFGRILGANLAGYAPI